MSNKCLNSDPYLTSRKAHKGIRKEDEWHKFTFDPKPPIKI